MNSKPETDSTFTAFWRRLASYGTDRFETAEGKKYSALLNQAIAFFFLCVLALHALAAIELRIYLPNQWLDYLLPHSIGGLILLVTYPISLYLVSRFRNFLWTILPFELALAYLTVQSILFGNTAAFFLSGMTMAPLPLFFRAVLPRPVVIGGVAQVIAIQVLIPVWLAYFPEPMYPIPEAMAEHLFYYVIGYLNLAIIMLSYYYAREQENRESKLANLVAELRGKDDELQLELDFAAALQQGILPEREMSWGKLMIASYYYAFGKVSGDLIDIADRGEHAYVLMADASGHGVPAALVTMLAKQTFTNEIVNNQGPAETLEAMNRDLASKIRTPEYLTSFMLKIGKDYSMEYCNAAHPKPVYYRAKTNSVFFIDTEGLVIGALDEDLGMPYSNKTIQMAGGDKVILFTDGLTEQKNQAGAMFGPDRVAELVKKHHYLPAKALVDRIIEAHRDFRGDTEIKDDVTVLLLELAI